MRFNIKADNYEDYQNKIKQAANYLYDQGLIGRDTAQTILDSKYLELPIIANDNQEFYSIDTAPKFCAEWIVKVLKYEIERIPKEKRNFFKAVLTKNKEDGTWVSEDVEFNYEKLRFTRNKGFNSIPKETLDKINQATTNAINNIIWDSLFRK